MWKMLLIGSTHRERRTIKEATVSHNSGWTQNMGCDSGRSDKSLTFFNFLVLHHYNYRRLCARAWNFTGPNLAGRRREKQSSPSWHKFHRNWMERERSRSPCVEPLREEDSMFTKRRTKRLWMKLNSETFPEMEREPTAYGHFTTLTKIYPFSCVSIDCIIPQFDIWKINLLNGNTVI